MTLAGKNLTAASAVDFGTTAGTNVTVVSAKKLTVTSPSHAAGQVDVTVTTAAGTSAVTTKDHFMFGSAPAVRSVSPTSGTGAGGTSVTVTGSGFTGATAVDFGSTAGKSLSVVSATEITVVAPVHAAGAVDVTVTTPLGTSPVVSTDTFSFLAAAPGPVTAVKAKPGAGYVTLSWKNPKSKGFAGVMIRRSLGASPPPSATAGTIVTDTSGGTTSFTDTGLAGGTEYSYALFAHDSTADYASGVDVSATTTKTSGVTGISGTVTAATGGADLQNVSVRAFDSYGDSLAQTDTSANGQYTLTGLSASSSGYVVCFDASSSIGGSSTTGYANQCYQDVVWNGSYNLPSGTTSVPVSSGATTTGIDAVLAAGGAITGKVTAATGSAALQSVLVQAYVSVADGYGDAESVSQTYTLADGTYDLTGLAPSSVGYIVCFNASDTTGSSSATGYADQCYQNVSWDGSYILPSGTTALPESAGSTISGINGALVSGGAIAGKIIAATGGGALQSVEVEVFEPSGIYVSGASSTADGTYTFLGLTPSTAGYVLCFNAADVSGGSSLTGYVDQCYEDIPWNADYYKPPSGTTVVPVTAGTTASGINASLASAGAIAGTVTAASGGAGLENVSVSVSDPSGDAVATTVTAVDGTYTVKGIAPSTAGYSVCFNAAGISSGGSTTQYAPQCWKDVSSYGQYEQPTGITKVPISSGATASGISASMVTAGSISGVVTSATGATALQGVTVEAFYDDLVSARTTSASDGSYTLDGLTPTATGYTVCFDGTNAVGGPSTTGYVGQCWKDQIFSPGPYGLPQGSFTPVAVAAGGAVSEINAALPTAGAISGKVTAAAGGVGLANVGISIYSQNYNYQVFASGASDGTYDVEGLIPSSTGYDICFQASLPYGSSGTGYVGQCYKNITYTGYGPLPAGITPLAVTSGQITSGINAALATGGAISGRVSTSDGALLGDAYVEVFDGSGKQLTNVPTSADGSYNAYDLPASASGDTVCFDAAYSTGGTSSTGYANQCYHDVPWSNVLALPSGTAVVAVTAGATTGGINAILTVGAVISGKITAAAGGAGLQDISVVAYDNVGNQANYTESAPDGTYSISGLTASTNGYTVCFEPGYVDSNVPTGYIDECFKNISWNPYASLPAGTTVVPVTAGGTSAGIDAALATAGAISGKVTAATSGAALESAYVSTFDGSGKQVGFGETANDGTYVVTGLPNSPSGYTVCFSAADSYGGVSTNGYADQCYNNVAWNDSTLPSGTTPVPVSTGATATGINAALATAPSGGSRVPAASAGLTRERLVPRFSGGLGSSQGRFGAPVTCVAPAVRKAAFPEALTPNARAPWCAFAPGEPLLMPELHP